MQPLSGLVKLVGLHKQPNAAMQAPGFTLFRNNYCRVCERECTWLAEVSKMCTVLTECIKRIWVTHLFAMRGRRSACERELHVQAGLHRQLPAA